jgi:hypothetical protein
MDKSAVLRRIDAMEQLLRDLRNDFLTDDRGVEQAVQVPGQSTWRRSMLTDLRPDIQHLPGVVALLDLAAERAPQHVTYGEVLARSRLSDQEQRSNHQRLSWVTKRLFGTKTWPVEWQQAANGETRYRMPTEVARWWREG